MKPLVPSMSKNKGEKKKKEEKSFVYYNCGGRGHTSRQCPNSALFCGVRFSTTYSTRQKRENRPYQCKGVVEG